MPAIGQGNLKFYRAYRAMVTVGEMMTDRSYLIAADTIPATFDEFMDKYVLLDDGAAGSSHQNMVVQRSRMTIACQRRRDEGLSSSTAADTSVNGLVTPDVERAVVIFLDVEKFTVGDLSTHVQNAERSFSCKTMIIVMTAKPNLLVRRAAEAMNREKGIKVELFEEDDLAVNITHHELVPKHTPLTEKEVQEVLHAHAIKKHQLPRLLTSDPVAAYFGLERGQVVRIERKSASAGVYVTYRQVM